MSDLFCRHNRFRADCPICSRGTVLEPRTPGTRRASPRTAGGAAGAAGSRRAAGGQRSAGPRGQFRGPYAAAGPYERDGDRYDVRLERVPGGLRLAEWSGGQLVRRAPVLATEDLRPLLAEACERGFARGRDADRLEAALAAVPAAAAGAAGTQPTYGASRGRAGELSDELRVERLEGDRLRVGRWLLRPGAGWELQEAPTMLPAARYADALADAAARGVL